MTRQSFRDRCRSCRWASLMQYADGHYSTQCTHPVNDRRTTRDVAILEECPETKEKKQQSPHTGLTNPN